MTVSDSIGLLHFGYANKDKKDSGGRVPNNAQLCCAYGITGFLLAVNLVCLNQQLHVEQSQNPTCCAG